jgi:hypothetical protein
MHIFGVYCALGVYVKHDIAIKALMLSKFTKPFYRPVRYVRSSGTWIYADTDEWIFPIGTKNKPCFIIACINIEPIIFFSFIYPFKTASSMRFR